MERIVSHQTVVLERGRHPTPSEGACVMELASMLAGEPFSDHPRSVCPALGAILRPYNDSLPDERRQDLYVYASRVVGTRGSRELTRRRTREALAFFLGNERRDQPMPLSVRLFRRIPGTRLQALARATARFACRTSDASHAQALALLDRLIALGPSPGDAVEAALVDECRAGAGPGPRAC
jgi:hypothetical protein